MLIKRLKVSGLLSFGPKGIELPLQSLNVLIGPNGSGKSNLVEILALLKASPNNLPAPMKEMGGVREWFWKGEKPPNEAVIEVLTDQPPTAKQDVRHRLTIAQNGERFEVVDEQIEHASPNPGYDVPFYYYNYRRGHPFLKEFDSSPEESFDRENIRPEESILSQVTVPQRYAVLAHLGRSYEGIFLFRNWEFGPNAAIRKASSPDAPNDFLRDGGVNIDVVVSSFRGAHKRQFIQHLQDLFEGIEDFTTPTGSNGIMLYLEEQGGRSIPKTRLSDGTLRYICLLAILLHPTPPPLIVIEEPEFGLHPDIVPQIAKLLIGASKRTQLVVTTHSRMLIDALGETPEAVIVCERHAGESFFERLDAEDLKEWLKQYSLGDLWSSGELGGNRW
ncbi:MAG: AAA family ATPase [Fimbriimonas sp.]|nr:AAA family ATPase [Fimbriimonas sp.]